MANIKFVDIPDFEGYMINELGEVFSKKRNIIMKHQIKHKKGRGCQCFVYLRVNGKQKRVHVSSLMKRTFFNCKRSDYVLRRKDGCLTNFCIENLELMHIDKFRKANKPNNQQRVPVWLLDSDCDVVKTYPSMKDCSKDLFMSMSGISSRIKRNNVFPLSEEFDICIADDDESYKKAIERRKRFNEHKN